MTTTAETTARRRLAAALREAGVADRAPARQSFSARYVASEGYRTARDSHGVIPAAARSVNVASARELVEALHLRTFTDLAPFSIESVPHVAALPLPALVPQLVETIPTVKNSVLLAPESSDQPAAGGGPAGTPVPEAGVGFASSAPVTQLARFGVAWPVSRGVLDDEGVVQSLLERRLRLNFGFGLEDLILAGPAGGACGTGILSTPNLPTVAKGGNDVYRLDTILRAVAAVEGAGWYTAPLTVVAHPTTLEAVRAEKAAIQGTATSPGRYVFDDELVPEVEAWVPSTQVPPGTAVVADLFDAVALFVKDGLAVEMAGEHTDMFVRGMVEMMLATRALVWVRNASAVCLATGL